MHDSNFWSFDKLFNRICIFILLFLMIIAGFQYIPIAFLAHTNSLSSVIILSVVFFLLYFAMIWVSRYCYTKHSINNLKQKITLSNVKLVVICYILSQLLEEILFFLSKLLYHQSTSGNQQNLENMVSTNHATAILMLFGIVILSPILEELVFRGYFMDALFPTRFKWLPIILSGLIFGLAHTTNFNVFFILIYSQIGMFLAYVYKKTNNLKVSIALHMLNNIISAILMLKLLF
ncbi:CPBP family intramembrane metalloprotease [Apilactobacillus apisilvae]|uniref:CPBP family intramembrane metalloprotease n=1 Tax=Apilactobacillus apisilvae TaxID=2923364 RepID=A0ABY4PGX7_9LACO|nr:type II CAAX endopeptidase family protein [Apilactobacillus apisilvae]UQS84908.1 CPBP family intramembrane metalloprotease [Apilactobacillus apisilvae]